eukprot:21045_5
MEGSRRRRLGHILDFVCFCGACYVLKEVSENQPFSGTLEIARKANMARNLRRMYKQFPNDYNIIPKTWLLPQELPDFRKVLKRNRNRTYILKPDAGSQGSRNLSR